MRTAAARTASDLPKPPKAMALAERRQQVKRDRGELSPMHNYIDPRAEEPTGTPHPRPTEPADRGPAAGKLASPFGAQATGNPSWVSAYATAYPAMLSIGGQLQLPTGTTASQVSGMLLYVRDEAGNYIHQQEIKRATGDPSGRYLDNGAWCYGWWPSNAYPAGQCFW